MNLFLATKCKPAYKKRASWTQSDLDAAIAAVKEGMRVRRIEQVYNIPRRTLNRYLQSGLPKLKPGRKQILTTEQGHDLEERIIKIADLGSPLTSVMIRKEAFLYCESNNIPNNFDKHQRMAGKYWLEDYLKKYPAVARRRTRITRRNRTASDDELTSESD